MRAGEASNSEEYHGHMMHNGEEISGTYDGNIHLSYGLICQKFFLFCLFGYFLALSATFGQVYGHGHMMHNGVEISCLGFLRDFLPFWLLFGTFCNFLFTFDLLPYDAQWRRD